MSRELSRGEFLVCQLVGATLIALVSGFVLIKGIEAVSDASQPAAKSQQQAHSTRSGKKNSSQQSVLATPPSKRLSADASPDDTAAATRPQKMVVEALKARGLEIAQTLQDTKDVDRDVTVVAKAVRTSSFKAVPQQGAETVRLASAETDSREQVREAKPATSLGEKPFAEQDLEQVQSRLRDLGFLSYAGDGTWDVRSKKAVREFKLANRLANDDVLDLATREKLKSPAAVRADQSFLGNWCRAEGTKKLRLSVSSRGTRSSAGTICTFRNIQAENGGWRVRANCSEGKETWSADGKITVSTNKLAWASERDVVNYSRCN
jgi:peptidoglycan hydrolase-like protein with peptidoglycan-binding domain